MNESIHGHEVMHLLMSPATGQAPRWTRSTLADELAKRYGQSDWRFHTCSMQAMTLDGLLDFLARSGKLMRHPDGGLELLFEKTCIAGNHDHEHDHDHHRPGTADR